MATEYDRLSDEPRRTSPFLRALIIAGIGFAGGLVAMGYLLTHWDVAAEFLKGQKSTPRPPVAMMKKSAAALSPSSPVDSDIISMRIGAIETRLDSIEDSANAASGNANRAEGLLVAFAARRALDRGAQLGYIEALLRERFGATQPQAVATIISAARQPVTLEELRAGLEEAGPALAGPGPDEGWWEGFRRELAGLIVVRHSNTPSPAASDRLARAKALIAAGQIDEALAEVARLPGRDAAAAWIAGARRYVLARGALDRIETAALLQPPATAPGASVTPVP